MNLRALRYGVLALVCLLAACKGRREPVKPIASFPLICCLDHEESTGRPAVQ